MFTEQHYVPLTGGKPFTAIQATKWLDLDLN